MPYLYLIGSVIFVASESITGGIYNKTNVANKGASPFYRLLHMSSVFLFWTVLFLCDLSINARVLWYSALFASFYALCCASMILALKTGPVLLTSLFLQLSLIGTTVWGFFFWNAPFTALVAIGLILVVAAVFLCLYTGESENNGQKINIKWMIYVALMFIGNAACSIVQKTQQMKFDGKYGNFMMWVATGLSAIIALILFLGDDKTDSKIIMKESGYIPIVSGVFNGLLNLFVIVLATSTLSPSLIYPVIGVGSLMITTVFATVVFKEKMRWWQWIGIVIGMVSVGILSL